jgi:hypothetical protein
MPTRGAIVNPSTSTEFFAVIKSRLFVTAALALAGTLSTGAALARGDVQWSVTVGAPVYAQPVPVYTQPVPVYEPAPVYYPAPVYRPVPVYTQPAPVYRHYPQHPAQYDPYQRPYHHPRYYRQPTHWDHDGDGIPNRRDPVYNPRWDIDGDGIPNRHDRDRDGDGVPNWHDRNDNRPWRGR